MIKCARMCATKSTQVEIGDAFNSVKINRKTKRLCKFKKKGNYSGKYSTTFK